MEWIIMVLAMLWAITLVICYALLVMAHDADERADRMYEEWRKRNDKADRRR